MCYKLDIGSTCRFRLNKFHPIPVGFSISSFPFFSQAVNPLFICIQLYSYFDLNSKNKTSCKTEFPSFRKETTTREEYESDWEDSHYDASRSFNGALRHAMEDQQLKSAYYFDGTRFVAIQVIMDVNSGECQLILPMDHPHHLGVPEEVPVFETRSVAIEELTHR